MAEIPEPQLTDDERRVIFRKYARYGLNYSQSQPLTAEEQEYDTTLRAIDYAVEKINALPLSVFTAGEFKSFMWRPRSTNPSQEELNEELRKLGAMLDKLTLQDAR